MLSCIIHFDCLSIRMALKQHRNVLPVYQGPLENHTSTESPEHGISIAYNREYESSSIQCEMKELPLFRGKVYTRVI